MFIELNTFAIVFFSGEKIKFEFVPCYTVSVWIHLLCKCAMYHTAVCMYIIQFRCAFWSFFCLHCTFCFIKQSNTRKTFQCNESAWNAFYYSHYSFPSKVKFISIVYKNIAFAFPMANGTKHERTVCMRQRWDNNESKQLFAKCVVFMCVVMLMLMCTFCLCRSFILLYRWFVVVMLHMGFTRNQCTNLLLHVLAKFFERHLTKVSGIFHFFYIFCIAAYLHSCCSYTHFVYTTKRNRKNDNK